VFICCEQALVVAEAVTSLTVTAVYGRGRDVATRPCWTVSLLTLPRHGQSPSSCSDRLVDGGRRLDGRGRGRGRAVRSRQDSIINGCRSTIVAHADVPGKRDQVALRPHTTYRRSRDWTFASLTPATLPENHHRRRLSSVIGLGVRVSVWNQGWVIRVQCKVNNL